MPRSMPAAALVLALAQGVAGAKRASKAAAAAAAQAAQADTTWRIAVIVTLFVLVLTLLALNHVTRPFKFWGFSRAAAPFNGGDPKPPKPEPPTPFDEARTRRMKRMFQKHATRDDDGMIAASNLGELFADCGHACLGRGAAGPAEPLPVAQRPRRGGGRPEDRVPRSSRWPSSSGRGAAQAGDTHLARSTSSS